MLIIILSSYELPCLFAVALNYGVFRRNSFNETEKV